MNTIKQLFYHSLSLPSVADINYAVQYNDLQLLQSFNASIELKRAMYDSYIRGCDDKSSSYRYEMYNSYIQNIPVDRRPEISYFSFINFNIKNHTSILTKALYNGFTEVYDELLTYTYPYYCIYLIPALVILLSRNDIERAINLANTILHKFTYFSIDDRTELIVKHIQPCLERQLLPEQRLKFISLLSCVLSSGKHNVDLTTMNLTIDEQNKLNKIEIDK